MNRINNLFKQKGSNILSIYFTAGYPKLEDTIPIIVELDATDADIIEIGIPFSDPMADGVTIQGSNQIALQNAMTLGVLLEQLQDLRNVTNIPVVLMGYFNPIFKYGVEKFCKQASEYGVDGVIIPDLPVREYLTEYKAIFEKYDLHVNFLITPATTEERVREIDNISKGFIYMVTSFGVTGRQQAFAEQYTPVLEKISKLKLKTPVLAGFGISNKEGFRSVCQYVNGAIIGSSFIKAIGEEPDNISNNIQQFVKTIIQ